MIDFAGDRQFLMKERLRQYYLLMRLHRPIGTWLLLWPTLWALWLAAEGIPDLGILGIFVAAVFIMRAAGCVINDYADRDFDRHVERTRERPLTTGKVSPREALGLFAVLIFCALILVLFLNTLTILLSLGALVLAAIYPFMKRYTHFPQVVLGMAFSWAIPMAFSAQLGEVPWIAWALYVVTVCWIVAYDTMYAMVDREDDLKIGIKSTAVFFGHADRLIIGLLQLLFLTGMLLIAWHYHAGPYFYAGILLAAALSLYQQYLIRAHDRAACFKAFLNNNWVGMAIFAGIFLNYLLH